MAVSGRWLVITWPTLLTVLCLFARGSNTAFKYDAYGDILFDDVEPVDTGQQDHSTEGKNSFC